jgi:beta-glucosidase
MGDLCVSAAYHRGGRSSLRRVTPSASRPRADPARIDDDAGVPTIASSPPVSGARAAHVLALAAACLSMVAVGSERPRAAAADQPALGVRSRAVLTVDGARFKDANGNGALDPYEDWRRPVEARVADLVARMTVEEKAGLMLIDTIAPGCGGTVTAAAARLVETQRMTRFILRNVVKATAAPCDGSVTPTRNGFVITPSQMAEFTNAIQALAESQRLGIPVLFKDNARNHYDTDPRFGI